MLRIPDTRDSRCQSPVFFGYELAAKPGRRDAEISLDDEEGLSLKTFVPLRKGKACAVCLVGKAGKIDSDVRLFECNFWTIFALAVYEALSSLRWTM